MVSVRRRPAPVTASRTGIGSSFSAGSSGSGYHSSVVGGGQRSHILRTVLVAFIVLQGLNLTVRVIHRIISPPPPSSAALFTSTSSVLQQPKKTTSDVHQWQPPRPLLRPDASQQRQTGDTKSGAQPPPPVDPHLPKKDDVTDVDDVANGVGGVQQEHGQGDDHKADREEVELDVEHLAAGNEQDTTERIQKTELQVDSAQTGATALGYVVDLVQFRQQPNFRRNQSTFLASLTEGEAPSRSLVSALAGGVPLKPCEYLQPSSSGRGSRLLQRAVCRDPSSHLVAYNPAAFPRYLCGRSIPPHGILQMKDIGCQETAHVFATQQHWQGGGIRGQAVVGVPPLVVKAYNTTSTNQPVLEAVDCNVPCQFEQNLPPKGERTIDGTNWKLVVNEADPYVDEKAKPELTAFKRDVYYSTMSLRSSVPLSHYNFELYNLRQTKALDWEKAANAATYLIDSNCNPYGLRRQKWYAAMAAGFTTRSYGKCDHNTDLGPGETVSTMQGRLALSAKNRIHLAFEASGEKDYTTSIVWESLLSGAVPAILGARNANDFLPKHSAILASNFNDWDKYAAHVKNVSETKGLWESYHAWRTDEAALQEFEARFNFTRTTPQCRTCRWAYSKLHGLGWDHQQQEIVETHIPRRLCLDSSSHLVVQPFREVWSPSTSASKLPEAAATGKDVCQMPAEAQAYDVQQDAIKVKRSVVLQDGVIDMMIHSVEATEPALADVVVRFHVNVRNLDGTYFSHPHSLVPTTHRGSMVSSAAIQDERAKVTVLASWETQIRSPEEGVIEVVVLNVGEKLHDDETRRIRIISEDISVIHDKLTEYFPSSFAKQMTIDFVDTLEFFYTT